ncbi:MAG: type II toxin-antitoxin system VapC family toxin [Microcoleaceae cyanobacterium]|jgi:PIN domain nuclease of toxin-antitoxin system
MILLDTHIWLWLLHDPSQLSETARMAIDTEEAHNGLLVSAISVWEIAVKSSIGKLILPLPIDDLNYPHVRTIW